ncbi:MAG: recombinase family protein [Pirellulales bacterium]
MFSQEFKPKNPNGVLRVLAIGRLSKAKKTELQTQQTMDDSCKVAQNFMKRITDLPLDITTFSEQISGLVYRRDTIDKVEALIESGQIDVVACEDIGRIYRNPRHQYAFVQDVVDQKTVLISVNDGLDTRDPAW